MDTHIDTLVARFNHLVFVMGFSFGFWNLIKLAQEQSEPVILFFSWPAFLIAAVLSVAQFVSILTFLNQRINNLIAERSAIVKAILIIMYFIMLVGLTFSVTLLCALMYTGMLDDVMAYGR